MTSKISFHKLRMEDFRHRIAMMLLCVFVFLTWDLMYFISIRNTMEMDADNKIEVLADLVKDYMGPNIGSAFLLIPLAVVMAIMSFRYLHSKKQGDFFHALPVKRSRYFLLNLENDFLIFIFSYILSALIQTGISGAHGMIDGSFAMTVALGTVFYVITFLMMYLLMTLCMILTGQIYVGIFGFLTIILYVPAGLRISYSGLANIFFSTFADLSGAQEEILNKLSPVFLAAQMGENMTCRNVLAGLAWILVLFVLSFILYKIRPAEAAGRAMAFKKSERIIKLLITVPLSILAGLFFYDITNSRTVLWLYFGVIVGAVFFHGIVEVIYQTDITGLWSKKVDAIVILLVTLATVAGFHMDLFGFDTYLPDHKAVKTVKIVQNVAAMEDLGDENSEEGGLTGEGKDEVLDLLEDIAKESLEIGNPDDYKTITVIYFFEDGKYVKRKYYLNEEKDNDLYNKIYQSKEYKEKIFHLNDIKVKDITTIGSIHPLRSTWWNISVEEKQALLDAYRKDVEGLTYPEIKGGKTEYKIQVTTKKNGTYMEYSLDIFPSYKNSIELIKKYGTVLSPDVSDTNIHHLEVEYYDGENNISGEIHDRKFIDSIKDKLYYSDLKTEYVAQTSDDLYLQAKCGEVYCMLYTEDEAVREKIIDMIKK